MLKVGWIYERDNYTTDVKLERIGRGVLKP
jgi:hypothetical protein